MHRLFLDEAGDHWSTHSSSIGKRYLGLVGVIFDDIPHAKFSADLEALKKKHCASHCPATPVILHREDILNKRGAFCAFQDQAKREAFDNDILELIKGTSFTLISVVIDKVAHGSKKYRKLTHPYHYALLAMLERYCGRLDHFTIRGDVMAESRGKAEYKALKLEYKRIYTEGGYYLSTSQIQRTLTSREIKIKKKDANIAGLQLADLLAHPATRDVLMAYARTPNLGSPFAEQLMQTVRPNYNANAYRGRIKGYGQVILG